MKPDWDKLISQFKDSSSVLIADVDCTAGGKSLCDEVGVKGYPTIKHGDPNNLEDYKGGRDFSALEKFAKGLKYGQERFHIRARESFFFCRIWQHSQYFNVFWIFMIFSIFLGFWVFSGFSGSYQAPVLI